MSVAYIPSGSQTYSKGPDRWPANAPRYAVRGHGAYIDASDGRTYVDCTSALGAVILGYCDEDVDNAVLDQMAKGVSFSLPTALEQEVADMLVTAIDRPNLTALRFGKNGTDAVSAAVRLARAVTGRYGIVTWEGSYHGFQDWSMGVPPMNAGVPSPVVALTTQVPMHDLDRLRWVLERGETAAVVLEAVVSGNPVLPPDGLFDAIRVLCDENGALLILDEMVTGFRTGWPGAINTWEIRPDLVCYGKGMANGYPLSALVGSRSIMGRIERDTFVSSTFGGEALSLAAARATMDKLQRTTAFLSLERAGLELSMRFSQTACDYGVPARVISYESRPVFRFESERDKAVFLEAMVSAGVLCQGYVNVTLAHVQDAVAFGRIVDGFTAGMKAVAEARQTVAV